MTSVDDIQGTNASGNYTNLYKAWEGFGMLSFGLELSKLSAGINVKVLKAEIDNYSADGVGVDIGFLYKISSKNQFAFLINNLYTKYTWDIVGLYEENFPQILSFGGSFKRNNNTLTLYQIDYFTPSKNFICKFGVEFDMLSMRNIPMDIRLGLNNRNYKLNTSIGFGYKFFMKNRLNISIDYAIDLGMINEGTSHLFTLTFNKD